MTDTQRSRAHHIGLWTAQILLAALFLFAGGFKLLAPWTVLARQSLLSPEFLKFIGTCEVLGALGLVLPGMLRIQRHLTPLAATGLMIIMVGAVIVTIATSPVSMALLPAIAGMLAAWVARGRWSAVAVIHITD